LWVYSPPGVQIPISPLKVKASLDGVLFDWNEMRGDEETPRKGKPKCRKKYMY